MCDRCEQSLQALNRTDTAKANGVVGVISPFHQLPSFECPSQVVGVSPVNVNDAESAE